MRWRRFGAMAILAASAVTPSAATGRAETGEPCKGTVEACRDGTIARGELTEPQVKDIQRSLDDIGYPVQLTGRLDDQTRGAVSRFQRDRGLPATGELDGLTQSDLGVSRRGLAMERAERGT